MKPLAVALSGVGRGPRGAGSGDNLTNIQYKAVQNCHNESPPYNEYMLIKMKKSFEIKNRTNKQNKTKLQKDL
jgi:hypothetical protein